MGAISGTTIAPGTRPRALPKRGHRGYDYGVPAPAPSIREGAFDPHPVTRSLGPAQSGRQALELITHAAGGTPARTRPALVWPFRLDNPHGIHRTSQAPFLGCAAGCAATTALAAAYFR
jgi:hypothetical protein